MKQKSEHPINSEYILLSKRVDALEQRVSQFESTTKMINYPVDDNEIESEANMPALNLFGKEEGQLESHIGEYGMSWLGSIVLLFGISFLVQYLQVNGFKLISTLVGIGAVTAIFFIANFLRNSSPHKAKTFNLIAYLLIYYVILKLHFFTEDPLLSNKLISLALLMIVAVSFFYISMRQKYSLLAGISVMLLAATALLSDSTHIMLSLATVLSILATVSLYKYGWIRITYLSIFITYFIVLMWLIGNPFISNKVEIITTHQSGYIYIYLIAVIYSLIVLIPEKIEWFSEVGIIGAIIMNGFGFLFLISLFILSFLQNDYMLSTGIITLFCIVYSVILKVHSSWKISAALYAIFGFITLSVTIYGIYDFPQAFFLLALQSLLVVSLAIWFRSKFIVIMNSFLYFTILMIYLFAYETGNGMNISFTFVALATARILNWKKERLTIRSEFVRNFYLITAFLMVLFTLYHLVSNQYITLSWTIAALTYFMLSIVLKNVKYRYLALANMIAAALFLFIVDLARIDLIYRVIALLFLALISIGLSFYYAKFLKKKTL